MHKGRTPYQVAMMRGEVEIAEYLAFMGADTTPPDGIDELVAEIMQGNRQRANALLEVSPDLAPALQAREQEMLDAAASQGKLAALRCMIDLGFELNPTHCKGPMHGAAFKNQVAAIQILLDAGGDPTLRDPNYFATPLGHALHAEAQGAIVLLDRHDMDIFGAAARGRIDLIERLIADDPSRVNAPFSSIRPNPQAKCGHDWATPLWFAIQNGRADSVRALVAKGADPDISSPDGRTLQQLATDTGIRELIDALAD